MSTLLNDPKEESDDSHSDPYISVENRMVKNFSVEEKSQKFDSFHDEDQSFMDAKRKSCSSQFQILCHQVKLLMKKNLLVSMRNLKQTGFQILTPIFFCLLILGMQALANSIVDENYDPNPPIEEIPKIPHCWGDDCLTVGVGIAGDRQKDDLQWVENVMDYIRKENDLPENQVRIVSDTSSQEFMDYLSQNQNKTQLGIIFCTSSWKVPSRDVNVPCLMPKTNTPIYFYSLVYNLTLAPSSFLSGMRVASARYPALLALKMSVDNALLNYFSTTSTPNQIPLSEIPKITATESLFPQVPSRFLQGYDVLSSSGAFYFFLPTMVLFVITLTEMVREKEMRLRQGLTVMGMTQTAYWLSWACTAICWALVVSVVLILSGMACEFDFFLKTPFMILLALFFFFALAMLMFAFFMVTLIATLKAAYTMSYAFILLGLVLQIFLSKAAIVQFLYVASLPRWVTVVRTILSFYPPFNFSKIFGDISIKSSNHWDVNELRWVDGAGYTYSDLTEITTGEINHDYFRVPSSLDSFGWLILNCVMFGVLAWYCDHIVESNRGKADPFYFPFTKRYWSRGYEGKRLTRRKSSGGGMPETQGSETAQQERERVLELDKMNAECTGMRLVGVSKTYRKYPCGIKSRKDVKALHKVYLEVESGELVSILGHNGAGKTTLINVLTGVYGPTTGDAFISNYSILDQLDNVRKVTGVCPQHDILWNELTAAEHIEIFAQLKDRTINVQEAVRKALKRVNLFDVKDNPTGTFSGGMKRRLSVAISGIGDPKIIFLDEPTTGMDPVSRFEVWKLIQDLKKDRVVILTTHSMEEADVLSDRIVVMADGSIRCVNTSLALKNSYGDGYRLTVVTDPDKSTQALDLLQHLIPEIQLVDESAGSLVLNVPLNRIQQMSLFFKMQEQPEQCRKDPKLSVLMDIVKDWGLSHTTLEEVFMKVTGKR
eukprot:CAMPEP_0115019368 /NCGR_PEP_ID=MMETSP0216-20121206/29400_1 /TAXON_ID=223996 /ORGANISM="Protocruzia adherens, Strain Boccale" /LENGTH=942 /DNA_ID=CAMNT_0002390821 /DNA_START=13 /DNA_END=2841 /DNA_ORIENTATION=-